MPPGEDERAEYRHRLKSKTDMQRRFRETVINPLREDLHEKSWEAFIHPLLVARVTSTEILLWVESEASAIWIQDNYLDKIKGKLRDSGMEVKITSEM
jgi:chromosomal replication initiation ATPase DnaA